MTDEEIDAEIARIEAMTDAELVESLGGPEAAERAATEVRAIIDAALREHRARLLLRALIEECDGVESET